MSVKLPVVTPERWYQIFWLCMALGILFSLYWIVRWGVTDGMLDAWRRR